MKDTIPAKIRYYNKDGFVIREESVEHLEELNIRADIETMKNPYKDIVVLLNGKKVNCGILWFDAILGELEHVVYDKDGNLLTENGQAITIRCKGEIVALSTSDYEQYQIR